MRGDDRGATLIEVIMGIVLLGLLAPVIFYMVFSISKSFRRTMEQEQIYQLVQSAIEQAKATGPETVGEKIATSLPFGYSVEVAQEDPQVDELDVAAYRVRIAKSDGTRFEFAYYWKP
jgi:type II secretory pathway pseudopilin PulG